MAKKARTEEQILRSFVMKHLRRASLHWEARNDCLKNAHVGRNEYLCAMCNGKFPRKQVKIDHIDTVIPLSGFDSFDGVIRRLFCKVDQLQCLCDRDHDLKTLEEDKVRDLFKSNAKKYDDE